MDVLLQQIINGLMLGSLYSLVALGYTRGYGILNLKHFPHCTSRTVGTMHRSTSTCLT